MAEAFKQVLFRLPPKVKDKFDSKCRQMGEDMSVVVRKLIIAFNRGIVTEEMIRGINSGPGRGRPPKDDDWDDL